MPRKPKAQPQVEQVETAVLEAPQSGGIPELHPEPDATFDVAVLEQPQGQPAPPPEHRQERPRLRATTGHHLADASVVVIDDPKVLGVQFRMPAGEIPPKEALEAVRGSDPSSPEMSYNAREKVWAKRPSGNPIRDRLDVEKRAENAYERLRESRAAQDVGRG